MSFQAFNIDTDGEGATSTLLGFETQRNPLVGHEISSFGNIEAWMDIQIQDGQ